MKDKGNICIFSRTIKYVSLLLLDATPSDSMGVAPKIHLGRTSKKKLKMPSGKILPRKTPRVLKQTVRS